jgi:hypothetical protein
LCTRSAFLFVNRSLKILGLYGKSDIIPVVFNRSQKIGPISGRSKKSPTFGQIIVLIYGRHLSKACGASPLA